ncbi:MAG: segregation/condensation protein A [Candidatus Aegiribacteria sp.]|nr:segregation/condensation protein A [Candidatus Aegiribacteria sp.]
MLSNSCRIQLESFEGPLDLLIYLIRRDEIDIYDIPMAHVADQYLEYIRGAHELNLDIASEYLVMAATLTRMKSKSLLPIHRIDGEEEEDPGAELRRQLILYRTFREIAKELHRSEEVWTDIYTSPGERDRWSIDNTSIERGQTSLLDLLRALDNLSEDEIELPAQRIQRKLLTVPECIQTLDKIFHTGDLISFRSVVGLQPSRAKIVSYFIAILELIRREWITFQQAYPFAEIELKRTERWTVDS